MRKSRRELTVRVAAAAILAPVVLAAAWMGGVWFASFLALAGVLMAREWCAMVQLHSPVQFAAHGMAVVAAAFFPGLLGSGFALLAIGVLWVVATIDTLMRGGRRSFWAFAGVSYVSLPVLALVQLRADADHGFTAMLWLFAVVWVADTAAYAAGRTIGGPKLAPAISPSKTWAGLAGAVAGAAAAGGIVAVAAGLPSPIAAVALGGLMGAVEQAGDFFESAAKRRHGLKDSGTLIPGHGGILDRVDGLMAAAVIAALIGTARSGPEHAAAGLLSW